MATLADLHGAIGAQLATKRIGTPVMARYHLQNLLSKEGPGAIAKVVEVVGQWLGAMPSKVYTLASGQSHTSVTLQFPDGRSAIVTSMNGNDSPPGAQLMLIGNHGVIYHCYDGGGIHSWVDAPGSLPKEGNEEIEKAIAASHKAGKPVALEAELSKPKAPPGKEKGRAKYGVLLVTGSHTHQENYARAFAADPRCKLIAVTDEKTVDKRRRQLNKRLAEELAIPYEPDLGTALKNKAVDIVSICAPPERRGRIAVQCAQAGKHLYLDKSLVPQLGEADALVAAVKKAKVGSHMFCFLTQPWAQMAKRLIDSGKLGAIVGIHSDTFFAKGRTGTAKLGKPRKEEYPPARHQLKTAKRELDNVGVYPITLIQWLTGKKFQTVYGITANYFFEEHQKHNVEDFGLLSCRLEGGIPVTITAGRYGWTSHPNFGVNRLLLVGSKRTVVLDANRPRLEVFTDARPWAPPNVNPEDPMGFWSSTQAAAHLQKKQQWIPIQSAAQSDVSYFLDCLDEKKESEMSAKKAAESTEVLLGGYLSANKGEVVSLPLRR